MYVWSHIIYSKSMDQPGKVASPARGQLNRKKIIFPCPRSCLTIWSRETGSAVPSPVSLLISILRLNLVLTYGIPPEFRGGVHLFNYNHHTSSGQSRVYRVTQLHTDGVHCRESAGTDRASKPQGSSERMLPWQVTMDRLIFAAYRRTIERRAAASTKAPSRKRSKTK